MPIPAAAGLLAATVHFFYGIPVQAWWVAIPWLLLVGLAGFLMVSTWRFWSGKEIDLSQSHPFRLIFVMAIVLYIMLRFSQVVLFAIALVYMFSGIWARAAYGWSRRRRHGQNIDASSLPESSNPDPDPLITHEFRTTRRKPVYKIAIVGASTLLGKELKDALSESSLAASNLRCLMRMRGLASSIRLATRSRLFRQLLRTPLSTWTSRFFAAPRA